MSDPYLDSTLRQLRVGDEIVIRQECVVEKTGPGHVVIATPDLTDAPRRPVRQSLFFDVHYPNMSVAITKRAKREYKVGDELTGDEVDAGNFRRGTAIVDCQYPNSVYVKDDRYWIAPAIQMRVSHFGGVTIGKYRIINLP